MNYKRSKIYAIRSHQTDKIYIGSTTSSLAKRFFNHKKDYNQYILGAKHYITSFELLQYEDVYIELLEEYPCENKMVLHRREGELIRSNNCVNKFIAGRTAKEYKDEYRDEINEKVRIKRNIIKNSQSSSVRFLPDTNPTAK
jgi:hypothetical protein